MNTTGIHPAFAIDYARAQAVESARRSEDIRRARAFRAAGSPAPAVVPAEPSAVPRRRTWRAAFRVRAVAS